MTTESVLTFKVSQDLLGLRRCCLCTLTKQSLALGYISHSVRLRRMLFAAFLWDVSQERLLSGKVSLGLLIDPLKFIVLWTKSALSEHPSCQSNTKTNMLELCTDQSL